MNLTKFKVQFCYHSDKRCEVEVKAPTYTAALVYALRDIGEQDWALSPGFSVVCTVVSP